MKKRLFLAGLWFALLLTGCVNRVDQPSRAAQKDLNYSESYLPPEFPDRERIVKIAKALKGTEAYYENCKEEHQLPGIAFGVVVDDSLILSGGLGTINVASGEAVTSRSLFRIASMTKSFTAMAILKLRDEGVLSLIDPVSRFIPELTNLSYLTGDATPLTIYNLLTMTAGFPEDNPWGDRFLDISEKSLLEQVSLGISFSSVPSQQYEYSNLGYGLLGIIILRVSGISFQDYISLNILKPLGMLHSYWEFAEVPKNLLALGYRLDKKRWVEEPLLHDGAFGSMGGLITSIEDFSKYISFHLSAWPPRSTPETGPVKRSTLREMHQMFNPRFYTSSERFGDPGAFIMRGYGFGLVSMKDQQGIVEVGHNGGLPGFGSNYMFYPQYGIGIMAFSNLTYVGSTVQAYNYQVIGSLIEKDLFVPRQILVSSILQKRKEQVTELIRTWDPELEKNILAANFYLDQSRENRMEEVNGFLRGIGDVISIGPLIPENQLRGSFTIMGSIDSLEVYFTLSPETNPKVQWLSFHPV